MAIQQDSPELRSMFVDEAREYVQLLNDGLLRLEASPGDREVLQELFRAVHSLKGMAGTMGYEPLVRLAHAMESRFEALRSGKEEAGPGAALFDLLFASVSQVDAMVDLVAGGGSPGDDPDACAKAAELVTRLAAERDSRTPGGRPSNGETGGGPAPAEGPGPAAGAGNGQAQHPLWFMSPKEWAAARAAAVGGARIYAVQVGIDRDCTFKGPRAYTVLRTLESTGTVVATWPSREALDQERFDDHFMVGLVSDRPGEAIEKTVVGITEVRSAAVTAVSPPGSPETAAGTDAGAGRPSAEREPAPSPAAGRGAAPVESTVRVETARLDALVDLAGELVITSNQIQDAYARGATLDEAPVNKLGRVTSDLQNAVMRLRMVPLRTVFSRFPRAVRDLARRFDKSIEFVVQGEETELDRHIVNEIGDPLLHLLRNAVDHGIEPPEVRARLGKPRTGRIRLAARHEGNHVVIELEDDGAGIDTERIRKKAVDTGRLSAQEAASMPAEELLQLIFEPGFSTASRVTDVSGRGVGMDAAKAAVESLGGRLAIHSRRGRGTTCELRLPLTLAIIRGLLMEIGKDLFAVPVEAVESIERVDPSRVENVQNRTVLRYRSWVIPLVPLRACLGFETNRAATHDGLAVVISTGRRRSAIVVDRVVGLQDLVIRAIGSYLKTPRVAGAAILGSGKVALILDALWLV